MSVTLDVCRRLVIYQCDRFHHTVDGKVAPPRRYELIEIMTSGWTQGARYRQKRFPNVERLFAYLNKLHIHGYLDDSTYNAAWLQGLEFLDPETQYDIKQDWLE